jgi:hypothetical protein
MNLTIWDLVLILVVSLQTTALAYLHSPRLKAFALTLPFPFTTIALAVGRPMDATNVAALVILFGYTQSVRLLHYRLRVPIVPAILLAVAGYALAGWVLARVVPHSETAFWVATPLVLLLGLVLQRGMPIRLEPGYRTTLPLYIKLPVIMAVVCLLILIKGALAGFSTLFPMVGVVGAYETRFCLWTFGRQVPVLMVTLIPLIVVSHLTHDTLGLGLSLAVGWAVFLVALWIVTRRMWTRWDRLQADADAVDPLRIPHSAFRL